MSGYRLPADTTSDYDKQQINGWATPTVDKQFQIASLLPRRVMPIVFLPGILGSNLRLTKARQQELHKKDNIAWRPDDLGIGNISANANQTVKQRQLTLDPAATEVDVYDIHGPSDVSGDIRHANVKVPGDLSVLLMDDPPASSKRRSASQKARERGWGEVFFKSYRDVLETLESCLNSTIRDGKLRDHWSRIVGKDPTEWRLDPLYKDDNPPLTEADLKLFATKRSYPVYAFGYNWLQDNQLSAKAIAARINELIKSYTDRNYICDKVILVTHSMGGLLGRAVVHPAMGGLQDKVAGVVHGVMPAVGAAATYKRIIAGFDDPGLISSQYDTSLASKVIGNYGDEVTCVLANSPGALQLLPSSAYGEDWLKISYKGRILDRWPKTDGNPYKDIYKVTGKWWSLIREDWINPSSKDNDAKGASLSRTLTYIDQAEAFHRALADTYHPVTYAHYGADRERLCYGDVVWEISNNCDDPYRWYEWPIIDDSRQGLRTLKLVDGVDYVLDGIGGYSQSAKAPITARILPPTSAGDESVPIQSADRQRGHPGVRAVFRQTGYEHQSSYSDPKVLDATLYSIVRIVLQEIGMCAKP